MPSLASLAATALALLGLSATLGRTEARVHSKQALRAMQANAAKRFDQRARAPAVATRSVQNITFTNPAASRTLFADFPSTRR